MFSTDPRTNARIVALQQLFTEDFSTQNDIPSEIKSFKADYDLNKTTELVAGVHKYRDLLDELIKKYATQRPLADMNLVDLNALRIAIVEAFILEQAPVKVCIDEAVELAKAFGGPTSHKLVNGVLGAIFEHEQEYIKQQITADE